MLKITTHLCRGSQFSPWKKGNWVCPGTLGREPQRSPSLGHKPSLFCPKSQTGEHLTQTGYLVTGQSLIPTFI